MMTAFLDSARAWTSGTLMSGISRAKTEAANSAAATGGRRVRSFFIVSLTFRFSFLPPHLLDKAGLFREPCRNERVRTDAAGSRPIQRQRALVSPQGYFFDKLWDGRSGSARWSTWESASC